jgi:hypothetical protein
MPINFELAPLDPAEGFSRADLEFRGVDHSGPSYEARIFFNNARASASTACDAASGYAGRFHVFGHGGCFGELGHCDIREGRGNPYDRRLAHPLTPQFKPVIVTEALRRALQTGGGEPIRVRVVAVVRDPPSTRGKQADPLKFESVSLITYQDPSAGGIPLPQQPLVRER